MTTTSPRTVIVVETAEYRIVRAGPNDFDCYITSTGYIGSTASQLAVQSLINEYRYDTMRRAPEQLSAVEDAPIAQQPDVPTCKLAQALANVTGVPVSIVAQGGSFLLQDDADIAVYGGRANIVATFSPADDTPAPGIDNEPSEPPVYPEPNGRAVSLQSIAIESKIATCANCAGIHHIQSCPELMGALFAPYDTATIAHLWATSRTLLAAKLAQLSRAQLHAQAVAFAAWLDTQTHAGLSAASVLHIWETFILAGGDPAMQVAA